MTKLVDYICEIDRTRAFPTHISSGHYDIVRILTYFCAHDPKRFKRIEAAYELEDFRSLYESGKFITALINSTNPRESRNDKIVFPYLGDP